ncbi:MAG: DEAD/DEAH box helicase [Bacteroidetes bacterium]|nr:DEAD/DEAH box helicase [Bacteroidota bacterium]
MALPYLIKHIHNNGTDEVIRRGKRIHSMGNVELVEFDELMGNIVMRVKDDGYATYYKIHINRYKDPKTINLRCTCPYNLSEICRHKAGALFQLQDLLDKNMLGNKELEYDQRHTVVKMKQLELKLIRMLSSRDNFEAAENFLRSSRAPILEAKDECVIASVDWEGKTFRVIIRKNEERNFDTSCQCESEKEHPLCIHKDIVFLQLLRNFGAGYFDTIRNLDKEKNKLLSLYGYSLSDDLAGKFEFTYTDGKPYLRVLDTSIKRVAQVMPAASVQESRSLPAAEAERWEQAATQPTTVSAQQLGVVLAMEGEPYQPLQFIAIQGEPDETQTKYISKVTRLDISKYINQDVFSDDDKATLELLRKLQPSEVSKFLDKNSPFSGIWENIIHQHEDGLPDETKSLVIEYLFPRIRKLFGQMNQSAFFFYLTKGKTFTTAQLKKAEPIDEPLVPEFMVNYTNGQYEVSCSVVTPEGVFSIADNALDTPLLFARENRFYQWQKKEDILHLIKFLPSGTVVIPAASWSDALKDFVLPLSREYRVQFNNVLKEEVKDEKPEMKVLLRERNDNLLFVPVFSYRGHEVKAGDKPQVYIPAADRLLIIKRNLPAEEALLAKLRSLHSGFAEVDGGILALKGAEVLKNNWFFLFVDAVKEQHIPVYGFEALKNFRFNTAKPSTKIHISSNTDWFDAKVEISFGNQKITVDDVKKALANKQQFVQLQDGSLGILPEEWLKKYALLFRVGDGKAGNMKLSKYHFSVIEELYLQRDEEELFFQLEEKYERLRENHSIKPIPAPAHLKEILRPYQESGFQWLNYLREVKWGGILADDMGLGKTLQALSFLHQLKQENGTLKAMVVCPTTLLFNWQNEITKFTPGLTFYIHHGGTRNRDSLVNDKIDVIITTYGTLRSDIRQLVEIAFDYVILDESQAIKNPSSKVTRAAGLLKATNRLCLSGTPLQNNTFDIYAQMNFLNPGMLGSIEFFKQEFSVPIDKFGEKEQKDHLRKLLYPFILRRTKEQVARDLPEKQEMVLFCEMGDEQRKIYDAYRNDYRDKILGVVEEQGIQKSQLTILQGLMKLRQICDSPAIVKEEERFPNVSVKLEEIGREITENISNHKALIFSQFLGMLALIKEKMKELGVVYEYFDGSSSVQERERAIRRFQEDDECRVFLISLKAGGVGLNLTAADYVYIVDPWWNPAVEQQAIDRTHRIGQTKNIFAYRMICTDTVEDKILKLQERKRNLARDLITDDEGFVKSLTREDVEYLFS